jgi:hypothetical protein
VVPALRFAGLRHLPFRNWLHRAFRIFEFLLFSVAVLTRSEFRLSASEYDGRI